MGHGFLEHRRIRHCLFSHFLTTFMMNNGEHLAQTLCDKKEKTGTTVIHIITLCTQTH